MITHLEIDGALSSPETEKALLGVMVLDIVATDMALETLQRNDFALDSYRRIFVAIGRMRTASMPVDEVALTQELKRSGDFDSVGGLGTLGSLTEGIWRVKDISGYLQILKEKSRIRSIVRLCDSVSGRAVSGEDSIALLSELQTAATSAQTGIADLRPTPISELVLPFYESLKDRRDNPGLLRGISTGIQPLDEITSGWIDGELTYVGALPGRGKTAFMVQMMYEAAIAGEMVGFISLEMSSRQILSRLATIHTGIHPSKFRDASSMTTAQWDHIRKQCQGALGGIGDLSVSIYDRAGLRVGEVAAVARRMKAEGCRAIFVDFVQKIRPEKRDPRESINHTSAVLADTCKSLDIPFIVASQLARRDANPNRRPTMQDLRESGNLEQDAHNVVLLYRPQEAGKDADGQELPPDWTGHDEIIVAKQREGLTGWADVTFHEGSLTFRARGQLQRERAA